MQEKKEKKKKQIKIQNRDQELKIKKVLIGEQKLLHRKQHPHTVSSSAELFWLLHSALTVGSLPEAVTMQSSPSRLGCDSAE